MERSGDTVIGLGDGTEESHNRMQAALDLLWPYAGEAFVADNVDKALVAEGLAPDLDQLRLAVMDRFDRVLAAATLTKPNTEFAHQGGKTGARHSEHLGHMLTTMQWLQRAYPGAAW